MADIIYLGSEIGDAAVQRRVRGLKRAGYDVHAYAFDRKSGNSELLRSLGKARNGRVIGRFQAIFAGIYTLWRERHLTRGVGIIYARNLDLLLVALVIRAILWKFSTGAIQPKIFYETLDIHPLLFRGGYISKFARWIERTSLKRISGVIVSSPDFIDYYFSACQGYDGPVFLMENKADFGGYSPPDVSKALLNKTSVTIAYVGKLRCSRSIALLYRIATTFSETVTVKVAGEPHPDLKSEADALFALPNVIQYGPFNYPDDLEDIYIGCDCVWSFDFQPGLNAELLVPNRLYEAACFGVPSLTRSGTGTSRRARELGVGIAIEEPIESALMVLFSGTVDQIRTRLDLGISAPSRTQFYVTDDYERLRAFLELNR